MPEPPSPTSPPRTREASAPSVSADGWRQIDDVVAALRAVLGDDVLSVCLYGSAVGGGLGPVSDLDLLAITRRSLSEAERRSLVSRTVEASGHLSAERPKRPIELTLVLQDEVRPWRYPPRHDLQFGEWFDSGDRSMLQPRKDPDLAVLLTHALQRGVPVFGPPPAELLDPVPHADLLRAAHAAVDDVLRDLDGDTRNVLLTLARVWYTVETGRIVSKDAAASWAAARLPPQHGDVVELAGAAYRGNADDDWDARPGQAAAAAAAMTAQIQATSG
jgi:streptomycin 3"-adenylyltransferase